MVDVKKRATLLWRHTTRGARRLWAVVSHNPKALFLAGIVLGSFMGYAVSIIVTEASYRLSDGSLQLIGGVNATLADKLTLDKTSGTYRFNAEAITPEMAGETDPARIAALLASQKQQTGGGGKETKNLYSLDLPIDPREGTKIYDINSKTSFRLIPEFDMGAGRSESGRVVYPLDDGGQAVYTVKGNGIKEDIVLQKPRGDELSFTYKLELPKTLEARLDEQGNLGIYSVDPAVSGAIAGALQSDASSDTARLSDVQENGTKNHLTYLIPAPTIVQSGGHPSGHQARATYELNGDTLKVQTSGLETLTYPISIDPSVVVTSTADFATGNDEGNISFDADAISRAATGQPTIGAWASTTNLFASLYDHATVVYNGYVYVLGGRDASGARSDVRYAPFNTNGTIGAWATTTSLPDARFGHVAVAYGGYMYITSGGNADLSGGTPGVRYAPINANGTLGAWATTTSQPDGSMQSTAAAYNGFLYVIGGYYYNGAYTSYDKVRYAPINADGTVGAWSQTTVMPTARHSHASVMYGGYLYIIGGKNGNSTYLGDIQRAPINADGTLGAWSAATSLPYGSAEHDSFIYGGHLYRVGGMLASGLYTQTVYYAPVYANGSIGSWTMTTSMTSERYGHKSVAYAGYVYTVGGKLGDAGPTDLLQYSAIDTTAPSSASMGDWTLTTALGLTTGGSATVRVTTRAYHGSATHNGYIYLLGGVNSAGTIISNVQYAPLNADGSIGAWANNTYHLPEARAGLSSIVVNGYLYAVGGQNTSGVHMTTVYYAQINADGKTGAWTTAAAALPTPRSDPGVAVYNGYMYLTGGLTTGNVVTDAVHYATINVDGTLGTWTSSAVLTAGRAAHAAAAHNGYLYVIGGSTDAGAIATASYAAINANGTLGSWASTTGMPEVRNYIDAKIYQGYLFIAGGGGGGVYKASTIYAKMNTDGTLGAWQAGTAFTDARAGHGTDMYNGYLYVTGGTNGSSYFTSNYYAPLSYGPAASTVGATATWQTTTASNLAVYGQASVVHNNFVYIIGGYGASIYRNDIRYAPLNANGTIGTWVTSPSTMGLARFNAAAAVHNGYLYVTGGQQGSGVFTNTVEYAPINADGTLGAWTTSANTFGTARHGHVTVAYNGRLYVIGGGDSANVALSDVKYATLGANGSVGVWADAAATTAARDTDGFVYGGRLYIVGGVNGSTYSNTVRYAQINNDGSLSTWTTSGGTFTNARSRMAVAAVNGYVYLAGGAGASVYGDLQYASIGSDGSIGTWRSGASLSAVSGAPAGYYYHTMVPHQGKLFSLAGIEGTGTAQSASYTAVVNAPSLSGMYSKQLNLGQLSTLNSVVMNGLTPPGQSTLLFRTAGANGVYGPWRLPSTLAGNPATNVQFVMYKVMFDDTFGTGYSTTTARSSVTDVTVDYSVVQTSVSPDVRLRHNKYFSAGEVLQPYETQQ